MSKRAHIRERARIAKKMCTHLKKEVATARARLRHFRLSCSHCRIFNDALIREVFGSLYVYDQRWELIQKGNKLYCPKCGECVWDKD